MQFKTTDLWKPAVLVALCPGFAVGAPSSTSAYMTDAQNSFVEDQTSEGINQVNMITCFMGAMSPSELVNEGNYVALVDDSKCDAAGRDSSSNSGSSSSGSNAAQYVTATVNSTRASNSDPMLVKTWLDESEEGQQMTIFVHTSASEAPSASNPNGVFRLDFCGQPNGGNACMFNGYVDADAGGVSYYEEGSFPEGDRTVALSLTKSGEDAGSGAMAIDDPWMGQKDFTFAYNSNFFLRSDGTTDVCFSRDASDAGTGFSVWRYGLYDADTGARVNRDSGFPIEYTDSNGEVHHGYVGYHGLWLPDDVLSNISSGATVNKVDYSTGEPTSAEYTLVKAGGKLTKYTRNSTNLAAISKIRFTFWASASTGPSGLPVTYTQGDEYQAYWNEATKQVMISGKQVCGQDGCNMTAFNSPVAVDISYWKTNYNYGLFGWSQSLGGDVFIDIHALAGDGSNTSTVAVNYRTEDVVYPSDYASIGQLQCISDCPTPAGIAADDPFGSTAGNYAPTSLGSLVSYSLNASSGNLEYSGSAVTATSSNLTGEFQWGIRSGKLFPVASASTVDAADGSADNSYMEWGVDDLNTYYVWETGPNPWNQFSGVQGSGGQYVSFEAPLSVRYTVPSGAQYGDYAGQTILLQYNGFGDLWGIPGECVKSSTNEPVSCDDAEARYVPEFMIPFDQTAGKVTDTSNNTYLVKWLDREIRFAKKTPADCANDGLSLPSGTTLPDNSELKDPTDPDSDVYIGSKPTVTEAPRVIHGQLQY